MIHIEEYIVQTNLSKRTIYNYIKTGKLKTTKLNGRTYIISDGNDTRMIIKKNVNRNVKQIKQSINDIILYEGPRDKVAAVKKIEQIINCWKAQGVIIKGYSAKSVYRKIKDRKTERKTRVDKFSVRNELLNKIFPKVRNFASNLYMLDAEGSLNNVVDLIYEYAKRNEDYFEVAAIPKPTLYRQLLLDFKQSGYETLHQYFNHYNQFKNTLPRVTGAFTDDIEFMDYIAGDDHKADVASVYVYDNMLKKVVKKQVKIWGWDEPVTMKTWIYCKVGDITAEDLILSLIPVIMEVGLPKKGLLIDNGIGRSEIFKEFWKKLTGSIPHYSGAYEPTNKATTELKHSLWKSEFDSFQKNFVSPHKEDGRHSGPALSPEEADMFFEDYKSKLNNYITGYYLERVRTRTIKGKTEKISIKDYFDRCWTKHQEIEVTPQQIRYALSISQVKTYSNGIKIGKESYIPIEPLPISYNNKSFTVLTNPFDSSEIDVYALDDILDRNSGEFFEKGSYITTLYNTRLHPEKRKIVIEYQNKIKKNLKLVAQQITAVKELDKALPDTVAPNSEIIKQREEAIKQTTTILHQTINKLPTSTQSLELACDEEEYSLTIESED